MDRLCIIQVSSHSNLLASERSERDTIRGVQIRADAVYICICMEVRVPNSSACHAYVMWAELGHCHFLYFIRASPFKRSNHWKRHRH